MESRHEVCVALDKMALEMLSLMQQRIQTQLNVENTLKSANIHLAKSRYIMGQQTVSKLQLPTENSPLFSASTTVGRDSVQENNVTIEQFNLSSDTKDNCINPLKWFGMLVPQNLHQSQSLYKNSLKHVVETSNIQKRLESTHNEINRLEKIKNNLKPEE